MANLHRILIVEDDFWQSEMVTEFLRLLNAYQIDQANDICGLWEYLESGEYEVVLMDYRLPDGTGLEALEEMSRRGYRVPVVMFTGQGDERLAVRAMQLGAADYLVKGSDYLYTLPSIIQKTIRQQELQASIDKNLKQIRYQALLLNNVRDAIVVWDTEGKITHWNPAAEALFGHPAHSRLGCQVEEVYLGAFNPPVMIPPRESTGGQEISRRYETPDNRVIWVSSRINALRDYGAGSQLIGYMDVSRDITERKRMEAQILAVQTQLTQSARLAAVGELASGVAHHINNPLTTIIAEVQILLHNLPDEPICRESAEAIERAGWRIQGAVQQLLEFSKPASSSFELLSVNETIEDALTLIGDSIRSSGVHFEIALAARLPEIWGNARQLSHLWVNLLILARDATAEGAAHRIQVRSKLDPQGWIRVEVFDDGRPIPDDQLVTISETDFFKPLGGRGTGVELNICQEIVRQHRGEITVQSDLKLGTTFSVIFPVEA